MNNGRENHRRSQTGVAHRPDKRDSVSALSVPGPGSWRVEQEDDEKEEEEEETGEDTAASEDRRQPEPATQSVLYMSSRPCSIEKHETFPSRLTSAPWGSSIPASPTVVAYYPEPKMAYLEAVAATVSKEKQVWPIAMGVLAWVFWSNLTILFNKWLIESTEFRYPIILTTWHLVFATLATQLLARTTPLLNSRHSQHMNASTYARQIVPIGLLYSGSLVTSNMTYLYLPVSFIQMLKAGGPIVTLLTSWAWGVARPSLESFVNILVIAVSVGLAVAGEVQFVWTGVLFQLASLVFDANRLVMIQVLLSEDRHQQGPSPHPQKMDPLVTLYYSAPVCAATNFLIAACSELPAFEWEVVWRTGVGTLVANAAVGFMLNVSIFVLIGKTSGLTMTLVSVPKNILLIVCSIVIWGSPVTSLQVLGYGIALLGLLYYSLGWRTIQPLLQAAVARVRGHRTEEVKYEPV